MMENNQSNIEVFTVSPDLIPKNKSIGFNLYINASAREGVDHFVCIWKAGKAIQDIDVEKIKQKFGHIYIAEKERSFFLDNLGDNNQMSTEQKVEFLKESASVYLEKIFETEPQNFTTEILSSTLQNCQGAVNGMMSSIKNYDVFGLHELIAKLDFHDHYTMDHSINTALYNMMLYRELKPNFNNSDLSLAGLCGMFHDIGKIHLPNSIINATRALSEEQYMEIKKHPAWGKELLAREGLDYHRNHLQVISSVVYEHHENYNGTGYPNGLKGEDINIFARMTSISDFFDAITTKRSYHEPLAPLDALGVIENSAGKKVDPKLFEIFKRKVTGSEELDSGLCLHDSFDPCQPHSDLGLQVLDEIPKTIFEVEEESIIDYTWTHKHQHKKGA